VFVMIPVFISSVDLISLLVHIASIFTALLSLLASMCVIYYFGMLLCEFFGFFCVCSFILVWIYFGVESFSCMFILSLSLIFSLALFISLLYPVSML